MGLCHRNGVYREGPGTEVPFYGICEPARDLNRRFYFSCGFVPRDRQFRAVGTVFASTLPADRLSRGSSLRTLVSRLLGHVLAIDHEVIERPNQPMKLTDSATNVRCEFKLSTAESVAYLHR